MANGELDSEESQFIAQSGDEENLWEILGIIAEKGNKYKVKWAGEDPKTQKPWGNSWVKKSDVTPDVVQEWKEKQAQKLRRKSSAKSLSKARMSATSVAFKRAASTSTVTTRRGRASMASTAKQERSPSASRSPPPAPSKSASPRKTTGKRKLSVVSDGSDTDFPNLLTLLREGSEPQKKKRKVSEEVEEAKPRPSRVSHEATFRRVLEEVEEDREEEVVTAKRTKATVPRNGYSSTKSAPAVSNMAEEDSSEEEEVTAAKRPKTAVSRNARSNTNPAAAVRNTTRNGRTNGKKSKEIVVSDEDDDEGSGTEVMKQLTSPNGKLSDSDDDVKELKAKPKTRSSIAARSKSTHKPRTRQYGSTERLAREDSEAEDETTNVDTNATRAVLPEPSLTPWTLQRLREFDDSMRRLDNEATSGSEQPAAVPYGESDVDSTAVAIMYPPVEDERVAGPSKPRAIQRESTLPDDVPEIVVQHPGSPEPQASRPIPDTPSRSPLKSKMKPRTPRSAAASLVSFADITEVPAMDLDDPPSAAVVAVQVNGKVNGGAKPKTKPKLGPIPQISPSRFYPHLPKSSLADTTIEEAEPEVEEPMSSIEQFDSPEKPARITVVPQLTSKAKGKQRASPIEDTAFWQGNVVLNVQRMRDRAADKDAKNRVEGQSVAGQRRQLDEILERRLASSKPTSERSSTTSRSSSKSPPPSSPPQEIINDEYDDFYVDDDPTVNQDTQQEEDSGSPAVPLFLPEEEEENTQDLLHEMEVEKAMSEGAASRSSSPEQRPELELEPEPEPEPQIDVDVDVDLDADAEGEPDMEQDELEGEVDEVVDVSMEPQLGTLPEDLQYLPEEEESQLPAQANPPPKLAAGTQEIPPTLSTHREEDSQQSNKTSTTIDSTEQKKHIGYMNLLNAKSEEINDLAKQLQDERTQKDELASRVAALEEQLRLAQSAAFDAQKQAAEELAQKLEASNAQLVEVRVTLETEREAWRGLLEKTQGEVEQSKASYETVMGMFREENGRAEILLREKKALRKELEISQKQARESVVSQRALLDGKVKEAKKEMEAWKNVATLVLKRNDRTEADDEMRKRAAEAQELRAVLRQEKAKGHKLAAELSEVQKENDELRMLLDGRTPEPEGSGNESEVSKSPASSLHGSHRSPSPRAHRSPSPRADSPDEDDVPRSQAMVPEEEDDETEDEHPDDIVKPCLWTFDDGRICKALFKDAERLKAHYIDAGHLPRPTRPIDGLD